MNNLKNNAFTVALNLIKRKSYFSFEIERKLLEKGFNHEIIVEVINKLNDSLLLNDEERFKEIIDYYQNTRKFGFDRIKYELLKKGTKKEIVNEMLDKYFSKELSEIIKDKLILKKKEELKNEEKYKTQQKIYAYLKRRGF